jgi:malate dehydrogenase (quinone)
MLDLLNKVFPENSTSEEWKNIIKEMIPSYGYKLKDHPDLLAEIRSETTKELKLTNGPEEW